MPDRFLQAFVSTVQQSRQPKPAPAGEVIRVSETVSAAAVVYETIRNSMEYDEEHVLLRNAIRRILSRRWGEGRNDRLASDLVHELVWARYLPNKEVSVAVIDEVAVILRKYAPLFFQIEPATRDRQKRFLWLIDVLATDIERHLAPPTADESLVSFAYQDLKARFEWLSPLVQPEDRDLQLYLAVHRAMLKSNVATLRYKILCLYYPDWASQPPEPLVEQIAGNVFTVIDAIEAQIRHPAADRLFRLVQKQAVAYHVLRDIIEKDPFAFEGIVPDEKRLQKAVVDAAIGRYDRFRSRLRRGVLRAAAFLFLTKTVLAILVEVPYDIAVAKSANYLPLLTNILFHPLLLGVIGLTVRIPEDKNTAAILDAVRSILQLSEPRPVCFAVKQRWHSPAVRALFGAMYAAMFLLTITLIATLLRRLHFNVLSITFFLFFLSLVTFFGLKIRGGLRDLLMIEKSGGFVSLFFDMFFLPIVRLGRWIILRAPRINVFLFFFDFIIEAPFKALIQLVEGWLDFLREKKEEI
ncbi:hypothetical protein HY734_00385 [Candidatus Uhrbacteria bacterium]|nr:hypothetical protein [Candidatus Uhrbacteria bacterium]